MRGKNRKPIASCLKLPQFTTMNVIDGQAGLILYASLIFYSLTIDNILNIIVLLILAGVSIAMLTGSNGLLSQAKEAKTSTNKAGTRENLQVEVLGSYETNGKINIDRLYENLKNVPSLKYNKDILSDSNRISSLPADVEINGDVYEIKEDGSVISVVNTIKPGEIVKPEQGNTLYTKNGTAVIPVGFAIVPGCEDISEGLVISDIANDINDTGNQFVWIPVASANNYKANKTYSNTTISAALTPDEGYLPTGVTIPDGKTEQQVETDLVTTDLIKKYEVGGFYISRYEAGKENTNTLVSKKSADVWVSIAQNAEKAGENQPNCKDVAKTFVVEDNTKVKSGLCTGIQWDMAMAFITKQPPRKDGNGVNDYIVIKSNSTRHTESLATSGQNEADRVCNIYDLEGNAWEYVAEKSTYDTSKPCVGRGGGFDNKRAMASNRYDIDGIARSNHSFRFVLYIM